MQGSELAGGPRRVEASEVADGPRRSPGSPVPGERFWHEALAVVLQVRRDSLHVLLWQRAVPPFEGRWALPGGPLGADERLGTSLGRHLAAKVDLTDIAYLEQLETRSDPDRDPRGRVLATAYLAVVRAGLEPAVPADTDWHPVDDLPPTAFDHGSIIGSARERLRAKLSYTNIGFALATESFTIAALRDVYAASLGHPVSATNLQRILTRRGVIEATPAAVRPTPLGGRPATLYRFAAQTLVVTNPFAAFRPPPAGRLTAMPVLRGRLIRLEPLTAEHAPVRGEPGAAHAGDRTAGRHPRGRAAQAPDPAGRKLAGHRAVRHGGRRLAGREGRPHRPAPLLACCRVGRMARRLVQGGPAASPGAGDMRVHGGVGRRGVPPPDSCHDALMLGQGVSYQFRRREAVIAAGGPRLAVDAGHDGPGQPVAGRVHDRIVEPHVGGAQLGHVRG